MTDGSAYQSSGLELSYAGLLILMTTLESNHVASPPLCHSETQGQGFGYGAGPCLCPPYLFPRLVPLATLPCPSQALHPACVLCLETSSQVLPCCLK